MHRSALMSERLAKTFRTILRDSSKGDVRALARIVQRASAARGEVLADFGVHVPEICFFSVTWQCNLECAGCYAKGLPEDDNLTTVEIERILGETTSCGTVLYVIAGGEPLSVPGLLPALGRIAGGIFMVFTNGTLLDRDGVRTIAEAGNILPVISIEGEPDDTDDRRGAGTANAVAAAMECLKEAGVPFAYSTMVTHDNLDHVTGRDYQRQMWKAGARFGFLVDYLPIPGSDVAGLELSDEDRERKRVLVAARNREARPMLLNFPEAEYRNGSCMSAGAGFVHISATGDVEPCVFCHYSTHNLRTSTYLAALDSSFFRSIRRNFANRENVDGGCMLLRHDDEVSSIARIHLARKTEPASERAPTTLQPEPAGA